MNTELPQELDPRSSVLFLGSGFSRSAKNIEGTSLPTSTELRSHLANILEVDPRDYDLRILADEVASSRRSGDSSLYQILYRMFTVKQLDKSQEVILDHPWYRIYTTNYDDTIECFRVLRGESPNSYNYDEKKPRKIPTGSIIHLHGTIGKTTEENVLNQLVLNENSYIRQHFERSHWYDEFVRSLRFCSSCYFVGYSLSDYLVSAILMQNPDTKSKTYFVTVKHPDPIFCNRIEPYGKLLPIEIDGFARACRDFSEQTGVISPHAITSFRYLDPRRDRRSSSSPTAIEILNLVTYGTFNYRRFFDSLPGNGYVVPRDSTIIEAVERLQDSRCLLIHSRIGNGKSIFLYNLAYKLSQLRYRCFLSLDNTELLPRDIDALTAISNPIIMFDSYNTAVDMISQLSDLLPQAKFVVTIRTSVQDVRLHEVRSRLPSPIGRVDLNRLTRKDRDDLTKLISKSGLVRSNYVQVIRKAKDFRDVLVTLYDNKEIKEKIEREFGPLLNDPEFKEVFIVSHLLHWIGQRVDSAFLRTVTGCDAYAAIAKWRETAGDIFALDDGRVQVRSSIFSEYLIQHHLSTSDIMDCVYKIALKSIARRFERRYQAILSGIMRVSILTTALRYDPDRTDAIRKLFERLREDNEVNRWPLFWLQYAILMTDANDLITAEMFIRTAYERAESIPTFHTFQIDTFAAKLFLIIEQQDTGREHVDRFDEIVDKLDRIRIMIGEESRRFQAIQSLQHIEPFVLARIGVFSNGEIALVHHLNLLVQELDKLSDEDRTIAKSESIQDGLLRTNRYIVQFDTKTNVDVDN